MFKFVFIHLFVPITVYSISPAILKYFHRLPAELFYEGTLLSNKYIAQIVVQFQ